MMCDRLKGEQLIVLLGLEVTTFVFSVTLPCIIMP